jgi:hypothetical protein
MPRAQRTKSAVHAALQRRAGERPGASFSVELDAPPQAPFPPHRFHTGVFRSRYSLNTRKHRDKHDSNGVRRTNFTTRSPRCAPRPWVSANDQFACRSSVATPVKTDLPPSPVIGAGEVSADASQAPLRGAIAATLGPATPPRNVAAAASA